MDFRRRSIVPVLAACLFATPAAAQEGEYIGLDVRDICEDVDEANQTFCDTLFSGIILGFQMARTLGEEGAVVCLPDDVASPTLRDVYLEFTWKNPKIADKPFRETLAPAFGSYFPCGD